MLQKFSSKNNNIFKTVSASMQSINHLICDNTLLMSNIFNKLSTVLFCKLNLWNLTTISIHHDYIKVCQSTVEAALCYHW